MLKTRTEAFNMDFEQYNQDQISRTASYQKKLAHNRNTVKIVKRSWDHKPTYSYNKEIRELPKMLIEDVLSVIAEQGIKIDKRTLQRYAQKDVIPKFKTRSAGRGYGRITDCEEDTPAHVLALWHTLGIFSKLTIKDVSKIRKIALIKYKYGRKGYADLSGYDIIKFNIDKGFPIPDIAEDEKFDWVLDYHMEKELSALKDIPEDTMKVINLFVTNWRLAYHILASNYSKLDIKHQELIGKPPIEDTKNYHDYIEQLDFIASLYSTEQINKAIKTLRDLDI